MYYLGIFGSLNSYLIYFLFIIIIYKFILKTNNAFTSYLHNIITECNKRRYFVLIILIKGFVLPDKPNPIVPYSNNELAFGEYSFYMTLSNRIISDAHIEITFP